MSHIFVSYASEDRDRIMPVVRALEATGWSVFWDRTIPVGGTWQRIIGAEIEACRCMVVIWSATSITKEWVYEEADEGRRRGVLVPVLIDDIMPPIGFRSIQAAKLEGWDGKVASAQFDRLIKDISRMLGTPPIKMEEQKQQADLETAGGAELQKLRKVHNALFCIKGQRDGLRPQENSGENVLLLYFNPAWEMWLVPNAVDWPDKTMDERLRMLTETLAGRLSIRVPHLTILLDEERRSSHSKKSRHAKLAEEYGSLTRFDFVYCPCQISETYEHLLRPDLEIHGISYRWFTLAELRNDPLQSEYNWDVVTKLGFYFDISLSGLPLGVKGRIPRHSS